ncbi:hypothetical protein CCMSSC00406_0007840 [Pleurotus cornucopiae]|uniref:Uncharacterized protein n=1 Tax=Pleurotus cornucopiae TaxID=5321 RepID=A0ACB7J383_PLECO|nr:hypothetical protein CCMSSC00406_0007840 [Pleurotus cornucopiae]
MPVDPTKPTPSRRPQRKITEEELRDIELKRIRGELSCAECRRLKLRCDKKVPCSSCVRRGCESICPCGILSAGQGTRFILADTQQLHRKISEMSNRIRALEDALAIMHGTTSSERHPLLSDDLLKIKFGAEALRSDSTQKPNGQGGGGGGIANGCKSDQSGQQATVKTEEQENIDALGTLTLDDKSGEVKYFGRSAGSETLLMANEEWSAPSAEDGDAFDDEDVNETDNLFPPFNPSVTSSPDPASPSTGSGTASASASLPPISRLANLFPFTSPIPPSSTSPAGGYKPSPGTLRKLYERQHLLDLLYAYLPAYPRAHELSESYLQHATYFFRPIKRDELLGEATTLPGMSADSQETAPTPPAFLKQVYDAASKRQLRQLHTYYADAGSPGSSNGDGGEENSPTYIQSQTPLTSFAIPPYPSSQQGQQGAAGTSTPAAHPTLDPDPDPSAPHNLATIFMILALGALLDINKPPYNAEAERYYTLGKAALSLRTIFDFPHIRTVQAVGLMATYHSMAGKKYTRDSAWGLMSLAAKLSQSLGLHRDSARWNFDPTTVQRRRALFWEIFAADVSHSLALGRPPAIHLSYVDCEFPIDEEATLSDAQEVQYGFWRMKHTFARDIFNAVAEATLTAKSPSYSTVLDLDRKVRELSFPAAFKPYVSKEDGEEEYYSSSLSLRGFYASQHRTVTMLYLHRSFFAQAMLDHPSNPLLSPFAPSFLTAYRCASIIIKATAHQYDRCARMAMRVWFLLYHTFSAAVIVGTVVTHSPNSPMATSALQDLDLAVELFDKASAIVLRKLKDKAERAYTQFSSSTTTPGQAGSATPSGYVSPLGVFGSPPSAFKSPHAEGSDDDGGDELAIFGGQKRVLTRKHRHAHSTSSASPSIPSDKNSPRLASYNNSPSPPSTSAASPSSATTAHGEAATVSLSDSQPTNVHPSLMEYLSDTNMFGLESMGGAHGSNRGNPFAGPNASLSMGGGPSHASSSASVMQGVEMGSARGVPSAPPLTMMDPLQEVSTGNSSHVNGGMGEMYQSFMSYLANRSFGGNALSGQLSPPLPRPVEHVQQQPHHQHFTPSQPSSALQSRRPSQSPSAPGSTVSSPGTPWSVISALSTINTSSPSTALSPPMWAQTHDASVPASPAVLQGMVSPNYMRSELLGYAGSLGSTHRQPQQPARQTQPTPGFPGFNGRIDASIFGNMYAETQMGRPAFGVHERAPNGSGMMAVDPREDMVEMGLSTESGMDAGWMSFMHNAGIMEYNGPGGGQHQMPL